MMGRFRLRLIFLLLVFVFCLVVYEAALVLLPYNPISPTPAERIEFLSVLPQGWAFFTKNPRGEVLYIYKETQNKWDLVNVPGASLKFGFGLNRKGRAIGPEAGSLLKLIPDSLWQPTNLSAGKPFKVVDSCANPSCIGHIRFVKTTLVPWAWARTGRKTVMPAKMIELDVQRATTN